MEDKKNSKVSVIIPSFNNSQLLPLTIESVLDQNYQNFEIIIVDAGSKDRSLELLQSYDTKKISLYSVKENSPYKMINKGIQYANGNYINVLFPGDYYIHTHTLLDIMETAKLHQFPYLIYCGTLLRDGKSDVKFLFRELSLNLVKKGQQPTSLQGCWFRLETFKELGYFPEEMELRGALDLFCRFCLNGKMSFVSIKRALSDYDLRWVTSGKVMIHFIETFRIVFRYFGFVAVVKWLWKQKDVSRILRLWMRHAKHAISGQ